MAYFTNLIIGGLLAVEIVHIKNILPIKKDSNSRAHITLMELNRNIDLGVIQTAGHKFFFFKVN